MPKLNKKIITLFLAGLFLLPSIGLAGLKLEQRYPDIPGLSQSINKTVEETGQKNPGISITALVKYITDLVVTLAIGAAVISLIMAGIQYLTNRGNKGSLRTARSRIFKSLIGIAILASSYLVLQFALPSFQAPELKKLQVSSQVILFTQEGAAELEALGYKLNKEAIDYLTMEGKARYFSSQWPDATEYLGDLTKNFGGASVNFSNFPVAGIGLMGNGADNIKILTFADKDFAGEEVRYTIKGAFDKNEAPISSLSPPLFPKKYSSFTETIYYFDLKKMDSIATYFVNNPETGAQEQKSGEVTHPPLSMRVVGIGPGVYLYGDPKIAQPQSQASSALPPGAIDTRVCHVSPTGGAPVCNYGKAGQRYLQFSQSNFADKSFDFDNITTRIEIRNNNEQGQAEKNNLIAILFDSAGYTGSFRVFFEKRTANAIPLVYYKNNVFKKPWNSDLNLARDIKNNDDEVYYIADEDRFTTIADDSELRGRNLEIGNIEKPASSQSVGKPIATDIADQFGKVKEASSIRIFKLVDIEKSDCQEVRLCNKVDLGGYCLSFTPSGRKISGLYNALTLPMPWFAPVSIPEEIVTERNDYLESATLKEFDLFDSPNKKFADSIRSIGIKGSCAVALFENSVKSVEQCLTQANQKECWDNETPGDKSQMFSYGDMTVSKGKISYLNLTNQPIGTCVRRIWHLKLEVMPCASAIAVYPVK